MSKTTNPSIFVLVDYENVQPVSIAIAKQHDPIHLYFFLGKQQKRLLDRLRTMMERVPIPAQCVHFFLMELGKNAVDSLIDFTLGRLMATHAKERFFVVSQDKGFDALLKHLKGEGMTVQRVSDITQIPFFEKSHSAQKQTPIDHTHIQQSISVLQKMSKNKPSTLPALHKHLAAQTRIAHHDVKPICEALMARGVIRVSKTHRLEYHLS